MRSVLFGTAAALVGFVLLSPEPAAARFPVSPVAAPSLVDDVACTVRRVRTVRPGGRVIVRSVRTCTPEPVCRNVQTRTVRPNGTVVIRTVRRCR